MCEEVPTRPADRTSGGQDVAILFATRIGHVVLGLLIHGKWEVVKPIGRGWQGKSTWSTGAILIQATLAYTLLPEGRGAYSVCVVLVSNA